MDPLIREHKTKHILIATVNFFVVIVSIVSVARLLLVRNNGQWRERVIIAVIVSVGFIVYIIFQAKMYTRMFERLKIYNNRIWDVYDINANPGANFEKRLNLSSLINFSELNP